MMGRIAPNNAVMWWCMALSRSGEPSLRAVYKPRLGISVRSDGRLDAVPADSVSVGQRGR